MYKVSRINATFKTRKQTAKAFINLHAIKQPPTEIKIYNSVCISIDNLAKQGTSKGHTKLALHFADVIKTYKGIKSLTIDTKKISHLKTKII